MQNKTRSWRIKKNRKKLTEFSVIRLSFRAYLFFILFFLQAYDKRTLSLISNRNMMEEKRGSQTNKNTLQRDSSITFCLCFILLLLSYQSCHSSFLVEKCKLFFVDQFVFRAWFCVSRKCCTNRCDYWRNVKGNFCG